jgi:protein-L-isoaspartate(D-aspartate) O-methyltransferase
MASDLDALRRHYAEELAWVSEIEPGPLVDAFATVPRERFVGPGPWQIMGRKGYRPTPDDDPRHLYHDVLVGLVPERRLNNGQPSFLAALMRAARVAEAEHVVHLGCGVGYYSAVMAEVVGPRGRETALEADPELAARASANLSDRGNVQVRQGDAAEVDFDPADVVFVNFGMTHPLRRWAEKLEPGGRLLVPITAATGIGGVLRFDRRNDRFSARAVSPTQIFSSVSARDAALELKLRERYLANPLASTVVSSLRLDAHDEDDSCWLHGRDVCLSTRTVDPPGALDVYAGIYRIGASTDVSFHVRDGVLIASSPLGVVALRSTGEDRFEAPDVADMRFERNADGSPTRVTIAMGGETFIAERVL